MGEELKIIKEEKSKENVDNSNKTESNITISKEEVKQIVSDNVRDLLGKDKSSLVTIFGIFASVLVFLSVQVQILQRAVSFNQLVFLSLLLIVGLLSFVVALQWITKTWIEDKNQDGLDQLVRIIIILVIILLFFGWRAVNENKGYPNNTEDNSTNNIGG